MSNHNTEHAIPNYGTGRKTLKSYMTGLALSLILTIAAFSIVGIHSLSNSATLISISLLAVAQLFAQVIFFLRLNASPDGRWNSMAFVFAIIIVLVLVFGSLWIMVNMNYNMMI